MTSAVVVFDHRVPRVATALTVPQRDRGRSGPWGKLPDPGAHSSAGERPLHTREVPGSIPGAPMVEIACSAGLCSRQMNPTSGST